MTAVGYCKVRGRSVSSVCAEDTMSRQSYSRVANEASRGKEKKRTLRSAPALGVRGRGKKASMYLVVV